MTIVNSRIPSIHEARQRVIRREQERSQQMLQKLVTNYFEACETEDPFRPNYVSDKAFAEYKYGDISWMVFVRKHNANSANLSELRETDFESIVATIKKKKDVVYKNKRIQRRKEAVRTMFRSIFDSVRMGCSSWNDRCRAWLYKDNAKRE